MRTFTFILGLLICQAASGQLPSLSVKHSDTLQQIEMTRMNVDVTVTGNIAVTTFDMTFYNPFERDLEGEFSLPLNDGQDICRYALEINGKMREGVVVEKIKARQTFEAIVRQNVDPGIAGITKGNFFKTRIFPVPAKGTKRVIVAVSETLKGDINNLYYVLPANASGSIGEFKLNVKIIKNKDEEKNIAGAFENLKFDNRDNAFLLNFERKMFVFDEPLKFIIPRFTEGHQLFTCDLDNKTYFYLIAKTPLLRSEKKANPRKITIFWDNSFSASKRNINKELDLLDKYLASIEGRKNVLFIPFNLMPVHQKEFVVESETAGLIDYIKHLKNDGATRFNKINLDIRCDEILLFSDAISTIGDSKPVIANTPIYTVASSSGSNYSLLKSIANETGGEFVDLNMLSVEKALAHITEKEEKLISTEYSNNELEEVYPNTPWRAGEYFEIAGILKKENATLKVNFGHKNAVTKTLSFNIGEGADAPVARIWAGKKIEALKTFHPENKDEIYKLGQKFNIVTPDASFIVLDRTEDYLEHDIPPPPELKKEYDELLAKRMVVPETSNETINQRNLERFKRLKSWYENPVAVKTAANFEIADDMQILEEEILPITRERETAPPPPPPPPQVVEVLSIVENEVENVVFTSMTEQNNNPSIKVLAWMPDAPYMETLRSSAHNDIDSLYFSLKKENLNRPSFYIQVADYLFEKKMHDLALRILTNTLELDLENPELLKVVARRLMNEGEPDLAIEIYREITRLRPEEPQSFRDLALAYIGNNQFQEALDAFLYILKRDWNRFDPIKDVVLNEMNSLIVLHKDELNLKPVKPEYIYPMPLDIRITLDWSSNDNDIDLWVIDPNGEKCYYSHPVTAAGGKISTDFTQGYGPEEFSLKNAKRGTYTVYVNYFSEARPTITGPVTVYATLFTHYGTDRQQNKNITVQLTNNKETIQLGQLEFDK
jgi:tetratricopeptide (TPR) repeat protein